MGTNTNSDRGGASTRHTVDSAVVQCFTKGRRGIMWEFFIKPNEGCGVLAKFPGYGKYKSESEYTTFKLVVIGVFKI